MIVRRATHGDEGALARLNGVVQDLHVTARPDQFKSASYEALRAFHLELLGNPEATHWLAERSGEAVGYLLGLRRERAENPFVRARRWYEIDQLAVAPESRRQGVARALVAAALAEAAAEGFELIELASWNFNGAAQAAFRRLGFEPKMLRFERKS